MENQEEFIKMGIPTVHRGFEMYDRMFRLMNFMARVGTITRVKLEEELDFPVKTLMDYLEIYGKVQAENRSEEFIEIEDFDYIYFDKKGHKIPSKVKIIYNNKEYEIDNPELIENYSKYKKVKQRKKIQVKRKYYTWVD